MLDLPKTAHGAKMNERQASPLAGSSVIISLIDSCKETYTVSSTIVAPITIVLLATNLIVQLFQLLFEIAMTFLLISTERF